jgi:adenylate cyclase
MSKFYKFSEFLLDPQSLAFYRQSVPVQLSSRAFHILEYLIERRGAVVEKEEILNRVWQDSFVEEANLAVHISALRRVLGEKKGESRFIRTVSGRGYSFVAEVEETNSAAGFHDPAENKKTPENEIVSIAVLPLTFENGSAENEYLANGVTQSLIGDLSKIQGLRVLAYNAVKLYQNSTLELQEIGFLLDADKILTGSIAEFKGKWEISVELVKSSDKRCLWAESKVFDAEDIFEVKKQIAATIAENLKLSLIKTDARLEVENEAQKLYYRGKIVLESRLVKSDLRETLDQSLKFFREAVRRAPHYALAYAGIGSTYCSLYNHNLIERETAYAEVKKAIQMALAADAQLSEAYVLKGSAEMFFDFNFAAALESFETAAKLSPSNADAYHWKSLALMVLGKFDESLKFEKKAVELDPVTGRFNESLIRIFFFSGKFKEALVVADEMLEFVGESIGATLFQSKSYTQLGFFEPALEKAERTVRLRAAADMVLNKAYVYAKFGKREESEKIIRQVLETFPEFEIDFSEFAAIYTALGETEKAFEYLSKAASDKPVDVITLNIDPRFKELRGDSRFDALLKKLNFQ